MSSLPKLLLFLTLAVYGLSFQFRPVKHCIHRGVSLLESKGNNDKDEGYGPFGSLIRQGPVPFFIRITNPATYEAAVNKYMAIEKCDRKTAQGNMDAYFQDPNGWAANKLRSRKTGQDLDYANMNTDPSQLILTSIWSAGIIFLFYRIFEVQMLQN
jgi:hypothetical protein